MLNDRYEHMPWDEIDTVVFDVGNVLLSYDPDQIMREQLPGKEELYPYLKTRVNNSPYWVALDHGTMTRKEALEKMIGCDEHLREEITRLCYNWIEMKDVIEEGIRALKTCKAHGKKLIVLSNYSDDGFDVVENKYDFFKLFDGKVISSRVRMVKPDRGIYLATQEMYGLEPARTLFIDDSPANIETALFLGWQGICFNRPGMLDAFFGA